MKLIMENWRKFLTETQETEECPEFSFYMDGDKIRRYGGEDDSGLPGKPLTDEEIILLGRDDECGQAARQDLEAWMYHHAEQGNPMIPDFSPSLEASSETKKNNFNVFSYFKKFFDSLAGLVNKEKTSKAQKNKKPYEPYPDNEEGFNIDCPPGYSIDPITGQEREPTDTKPCSEQEMNGNCWVRILTNSCLEKVPGKKPTINFSILKVKNLSFKDVFCQIQTPSGTPLTVSDIFEHIVKSQLKSGTVDGENAGLGNYEGTFGYRRVYYTRDNSGRKVLKSSFCPIPEFQQSDGDWNEISNDSRDDFYMLIPIFDSGPCKVSFVQKTKNNKTPILEPVSINERQRKGFGDGPYAKMSITSIRIDSAVPEQLERNVQSSQELINLKTSPDYGLKITEKENNRTRWSSRQLFNIIRRIIFL